MAKKKKGGISFGMAMMDMKINPNKLYRRSVWKKTKACYDYVFMMCEEEQEEIIPFDKNIK